MPDDREYGVQVNPGADGNMRSRRRSRRAWTRLLSVRSAPAPPDPIDARLEHSGQSAEASVQPEVADLAQRTEDMAVTVIVGYRTLVLPINAVWTFGTLHVRPEAYAPITLATLLANIALLFGVRTGRLRSLMHTRIFFICDLAVAAGLVVWGAALIPRHSFLISSHDAFSLYVTATLGIWTSIRGTRVGVVLFVSATAFEISVAALNGSRFDESGLLQIVSREGWLSTGLIIPVLVVTLSSKGLQLAQAASLRAGRIAERVKVLRRLHDTALQTLGQIVRSSETGPASAMAAQEIRTLALTQAQDLRSALNKDAIGQSGDLVSALRSLAREFSRKGMYVEVVSIYHVFKSSAVSLDKLLGAVRESLTNARKHGEARHAVVFVAGSERFLEILIRDHGKGFDQAVTPKGFGLTHSVDDRLVELGGYAEIWSAPDEGARVRLTIPKTAMSDNAGTSIPRDIAISTVASDPSSPDELITRGLTWFAVAALVYRLGLSPLQIAGVIANLGFSAAALRFIIAMSLVLVYDGCLLAAAVAGRVRWLLKSNIFFAADVSIAAGLNLWAAVSLPRDTIMLPSRVIFWAYMLGAVAMWTGLRGIALGGTVVASGPAVMMIMLWLNHATLTTTGWVQAAINEAWLVATLLIAGGLSALAKRGVRIAVAEALKAGQAEERAKALRLLQDHVLHTLDEIARRCAASQQGTDDLRGVRGLALAQVGELRAALDRHDLTGLAGELRAVTDEYLARGLRIELITTELHDDPPTRITDVLAQAVDKALASILAHSDAAHAIIRASSSGDTIEIVVRDHAATSRESASARQEGLAGSLSDILRNINGHANIESSSDIGTRVRLSVRYRIRA
jgi:signal transduction histidine kinase